jgi:signal transduction histidine kinase
VERISTEDRLIKSKEQLRGLGNQLQTVREEEKAHIAREVHDELGQTLTALKMELGCLDHDLPSASPTVRQRIGDMNKLIDDTIHAVQRIATELRPQILDVLGLGEAMRLETSTFEKRTAIECQFHWPPSNIELDRKIKITVFRIFQEALTNISRHSGATKVEIDLQVDAQQVSLEIFDNGRGIANSEIFDENSLGLLGIRERVYFLNGHFDITGNEGTRVRVTIPLEQHGIKQ